MRFHQRLRSLDACSVPRQTLWTEQRLDCLDRCIETLSPEQQSLIVDYYRDERRAKIDGRRALAQRLGITVNALSVRACRIRDTLEACVQDCCKESP